MAAPKPGSIHNILVVKLRALGDVLTTFPLLRALKELYPDARLTLVADETYRKILETNPRIDQLWLHPAQALRQMGTWAAWQQQHAFIRRIQQARFDLSIDLYGSLRTALWGFQGKIPQRLGFALRGRKYFYTQPLEARHRYVVDLNLQFAQTLGWKGDNNALEFFLTPADQAQANAHLQSQGYQENRSLLTVSLGGGWPLKLWGPERFAQLINALVKQTQCQVLLSGATSEQGLVEECARRLQTSPLFALGLPLRLLAALIQKSRLYVGNDSGPKYFAEAFGVPTLIFYGPTDFVNNNPDSPKNQVLYHATACRPCHSEQCRMGRRACLDDIPPEAAERAALSLWEGKPSR